MTAWDWQAGRSRLLPGALLQERLYRSPGCLKRKSGGGCEMPETINDSQQQTNQEISMVTRTLISSDSAFIAAHAHRESGVEHSRVLVIHSVRD